MFSWGVKKLVVTWDGIFVLLWFILVQLPAA